MGDGNTMKLYELKKGQMFWAGDEETGYLHGEAFKLDHIDGMYSVCYSMETGLEINWAIWTPVEVISEM